MHLHIKIKLLTFFFMSRYDPHGLYINYQKKSHIGQILQKKPTNDYYAITDQDIKKAIQILKSGGYFVSRYSPNTNMAYYGGVIQSNSVTNRQIFTDLRSKLERSNASFL